MSSEREALIARGVLEEGTPLAGYTSLGLGGTARYFVTAKDERTLRDALSWAQRERIPVALLGGGSNIVARDEGFNGLVIALRTRGIEKVRPAGGVVHVTAAAGEPWDDLVASCVADDLAGICVP
jgi:UDP-N-acetylmuramate dehydrogenase